MTHLAIRLLLVYSVAAGLDMSPHGPNVDGCGREIPLWCSPLSMTPVQKMYTI